MLMSPTLSLPTWIIVPAFLAYGNLQVQWSETWILPFTSRSLTYSIPVRVPYIVFLEVLTHTTGGGRETLSTTVQCSRMVIPPACSLTDCTSLQSYCGQNLFLHPFNEVVQYISTTD